MPGNQHAIVAAIWIAVTTLPAAAQPPGASWPEACARLLGHAGIVGWGDAAEEALTHIGPPDERAVPAVCACLNHADGEARLLAARSLALLEDLGRAAAPALEAAAKSTPEQYLEAQRNHQPDD